MGRLDRSFAEGRGGAGLRNAGPTTPAAGSISTLPVGKLDRTSAEGRGGAGLRNAGPTTPAALLLEGLQVMMEKKFALY